MKERVEKRAAVIVLVFAGLAMVVAAAVCAVVATPDINQDGRLNTDDVNLAVQYLFANADANGTAPLGPYEHADQNGNGRFDSEDLNAIVQDTLAVLKRKPVAVQYVQDVCFDPNQTPCLRGRRGIKKPPAGYELGYIAEANEPPCKRLWYMPNPEWMPVDANTTQ